MIRTVRSSIAREPRSNWTSSPTAQVRHTDCHHRQRRMAPSSTASLWVRRSLSGTNAQAGARVLHSITGRCSCVAFYKQAGARVLHSINRPVLVCCILWSCGLCRNLEVPSALADTGVRWGSWALSAKRSCALRCLVDGNACTFPVEFVDLRRGEGARERIVRTHDAEG